MEIMPRILDSSELTASRSVPFTSDGKVSVATVFADGCLVPNLPSEFSNMRICSHYPTTQWGTPHTQHSVCLHFHSRHSLSTALDQTTGSVTCAPRSSHVCSDIWVTAVLVCVQFYGNLCYADGECTNLLIRCVVKL